MSLRPQPLEPVPEDTVRVARAAFPKGNPYLTLRDQLGTIFQDEDFADLFPLCGQPSLPPWRLALVTVRQVRETLADRQAAEAVRARIDWKYLLGLELTDPGFDFSVLSEFWDRLLAGRAEALLLDTLLERCRALGLFKARGQQRTDATHVLAAIRLLNRLELALIHFFRHTAYRSNETSSLVVSDLWDGKQIRDRVQIQAKHMKKKVSRRPIPIVPALKQALLSWFMQLQQSGLLKPDTPVWLSRKHKAVMQGWMRETLWRKVKAIADRAGALGAIGCHSFRKLFCVRIYAASGKDIMKTAPAMGHRQISSTQQYLDSIVLDRDMDELILKAA